MNSKMPWGTPELTLLRSAVDAESGTRYSDSSEGQSQLTFVPSGQA